MAAVAGTKVGTGYVDIEPNLAGFQEKVGKRLNDALAPAFKRTGKRASRDMAAEADRDLSKSLAPLAKRFEKFGSDASAAISKGMRKRAGRRNAGTIADGLGLGEMSEFFDRARRDSQKSLPVIERLATRLRTRLRGLGGDFKGVGREVSQFAGKHLRGLGGDLRKVASEFQRTDRRVRVTSSGFGGFDGVMSRVNRSAQFFRNVLRTIKWPVFIAGVGLAAQGLSAFAAGLVATASALGPLTGGLIAIPALALAAAQAIGTLKLATAGVGDAVKAALDAEVQGGTQAVDVLRQQEDAAERVADAKRSLADAQRQATFATDDFKRAQEEARRELEDLRFAADEVDESIEGAALGLRRAKQELNRTLSDPKASALDVREAELGIEQAENDLRRVRAEAKRTRQDYRDAQEAGVKGMPQVVAAKQAEADAERAVVDAKRDVKRATDDAADSLKEQGSAATALQQKMAQLPPAAQKFVRFLVGMKPRLDVLRDAAADGFFPGAEDGLRGLMGNFKEVRSLVGKTAETLGGVAAKAGKKFGSAVWGRDLSRVGELNTRILERMGGAGLNLADALRHVVVAAEPFLDWLSGSALGLTKLVKEEAAAGRETGRLSAFFDRTRQTMELLKPILKGVGGGLLNVSDAADDMGNEILEALGKSAEGWRKWTDSTAGQNRLKRYFTETKPAVFEMGRLIRDAGKAFFELGRQDGVAHLLRLVRTELIPAMRDLVGTTTGWASGFLKDFGRLRAQGVPAFDAFVQVLAEHAGEAGVKIAKAFGSAFLNASIWGKLAIGGFLLTKFGGKGRLVAAGAAIGRWLGIGIGAGAAAGAAGGAGAGAGGAAAGGIAGGLMSKLKAIKWARVGALGIGITLADEVMGSFSRRAQERSTDLVDALSGIADSTSIFDAGLTESRSDLQRRAGLASNLKAQFEEMARKRLQLSASTVASLRGQARELDLTKQQRVQLERMFDVARAGRRLGAKVDLGMDPKKVRQITREFGFLRSGVGDSMKDINRVSKRTGKLIVATFGQGTTETRELTARNMRLTATAVAQQMTRSGNVTKEGLERIQRLIRNARLIEPTRKQAQGFGDEWAKGMNRTKEVTAKGMNAMIREAQKMPAPMRKVALETWFEQVRQARKSGDLTAEAFRKLRSRMFSEFGTIQRDSKAFNREFAKGFIDMVDESGGAMGILMSNLSSVLKAVGGKGKLNYAIKKARSQGGEQRRQDGGFIVPGTGPGDKFRTALRPGSFVLNREATAVNGFQQGGLMPVALEPGERVFGPSEVAKVGVKRLTEMNREVPRFQKGGRLGPEPQLTGPMGSLRTIGQAAIQKVFEGAKGMLDKQRLSGGAMTGSGDVESIFARVAKRLSQSKIASLALGMAGFAESGMRDLGYGDSTSEGALQLLASTAAGLGIDPHDEGAVASHFLLRGFYGRGGANALAAKGLPAHLVAQNVQGSAFSDGSNYLAQEGPAKAWMKRFGLQAGGLLKGFAKGGAVKEALQRLAAGGMVDPSWDPGGETIAGSIAQLIGEYASRYDIDITQGYGPGGPSVSLGHTTTGTATDVVPRSGNWGGKFAEGLELLTSLGFQVGYDGSVPGTDVWEGHGRGDHAHINWVGYAENETASDARQRLREYFSGSASSKAGGSGSDPKEPPEEIPDPYHGARTSQLTFGPMPKTVKAADTEIKNREGELRKYRSARQAAEKKERPGVAKAIGRNVHLLEQRLNALRHLRTQLRLKEAKRKITKMVTAGLGRFAGYQTLIEGKERGFNIDSQTAEQIVGLEPQPPEPAILKDNATPKEVKQAEEAQRGAEKAYAANFGSHVEGQERPAFEGLLARATDWRNTILRAEIFGFGKDEPSVQTTSTRWENRAFNVRSRIDQINEFTADVAKKVAKYRRGARGDDKDDKGLPDWLGALVKVRDRMREALPVLRLENTDLTEAVSQARGYFYPGGDFRIKPPAKPLDGSGSLEESLGAVQGTHWPDHHELLDSLPGSRTAGRFGGVIWDLQGTIEGLGLKIREAAGSIQTTTPDDDEPDNSAYLAALEEVVRQGNQEKLVRAIEQKVFGERESFLQMGGLVNPDFLPKFHGGGVVRPGPFGGAETPVMALAGERIRTPEQEIQMAEAIRGIGDSGRSGSPHVEVNINERTGEVEVKVDDQQIEAVVTKMEQRGSRRAGRRRMAVPR